MRNRDLIGWARGVWKCLNSKKKPKTIFHSCLILSPSVIILQCLKVNIYISYDHSHITLAYYYSLTYTHTLIHSSSHILLELKPDRHPPLHIRLMLSEHGELLILSSVSSHFTMNASYNARPASQNTFILEI